MVDASSQSAVMREDVHMLKDDWLTDNVRYHPRPHLVGLKGGALTFLGKVIAFWEE